MKLILLLWLVMVGLRAEDMRFRRVQSCIEVTGGSCRKWDYEIVIMYYDEYANYMCFPASTTVATSAGPKYMSQLQVGDQILSHSFQQGKTVYASVTAWLHRDTDSEVLFTSINTMDSSSQGYVYRASGGHNIGYNNNGSMGFKYADQLQMGDQLITLNGTLTVTTVNEAVMDVGLFSPMTTTSNFYIYPNPNPHPHSSNTNGSHNSGPMILVHCLAQVANPHRQEHWVERAMQVMEWLGLNSHQNQKHQQYMHPITHLMALLSPPHRTLARHITYSQGKHTQSLPPTTDPNSSNSSSPIYYNNYYSNNYYGYPPYNPNPNPNYGGSSYGNYYGDYDYNSNNYQQRENRKQQLVGMLISALQINSVITSL